MSNSEILNQVMNRWAANFRASQSTQAVMSESTIYTLGIFDLQSEERSRLGQIEAFAVTENLNG